MTEPVKVEDIKKIFNPEASPHLQLVKGEPWQRIKFSTKSISTEGFCRSPKVDEPREITYLQRSGQFFICPESLLLRKRIPGSFIGIDEIEQSLNNGLSDSGTYLFTVMHMTRGERTLKLYWNKSIGTAGWVFSDFIPVTHGYLGE
jgi:hypothetical protein